MIVTKPFSSFREQLNAKTSRCSKLSCTCPVAFGMFCINIVVEHKLMRNFFPFQLDVILNLDVKQRFIHCLFLPTCEGQRPSWVCQRMLVLHWRLLLRRWCHREWKFITTATFRTTTQIEQNSLLWNICRCFIKEQHHSSVFRYGTTCEA